MFMQYEYITRHFILCCTQQVGSGLLYLSCIQKILGLHFGQAPACLIVVSLSLQATDGLVASNRL